MTRWTILLAIFILLFGQRSIGQTDTTVNKKKDNYSNEFFISGGYNYCRYNFIDAGIRYYHWKNDGQTILLFAGPAAGCEFSLGQKDQIYIPYIGWQGQILMLGYGLRAEYATNGDKQSFGFTPELGFSMFEFLRINCGYRFVLNNNDPLGLSGFRFSLIAALPLSFLKTDAK